MDMRECNNEKHVLDLFLDSNDRFKIVHFAAMHDKTILTPEFRCTEFSRAFKWFQFQMLPKYMGIHIFFVRIRRPTFFAGVRLFT